MSGCYLLGVWWGVLVSRGLVCGQRPQLTSLLQLHQVNASCTCALQFLWLQSQIAHFHAFFLVVFSSDSNGTETKIAASLVFREVSAEDLSKPYSCKLESDSWPSTFVTITLTRKGADFDLRASGLHEMKWVILGHVLLCSASLTNMGFLIDCNSLLITDPLLRLLGGSSLDWNWACHCRNCDGSRPLYKAEKEYNFPSAKCSCLLWQHFG